MFPINLCDQVLVAPVVPSSHFCCLCHSVSAFMFVPIVSFSPFFSVVMLPCYTIVFHPIPQSQSHLLSALHYSIFSPFHQLHSHHPPSPLSLSSPRVSYPFPINALLEMVHDWQAYISVLFLSVIPPPQSGMTVALYLGPTHFFIYFP